MVFNLGGTKNVLQGIIGQKRLEESPQYQLAQMELQQRARDAAFLEQLGSADIEDLPTLMKYYMRVDPTKALGIKGQQMALADKNYSLASALGYDVRTDPEYVRGMEEIKQEVKSPYDVAEHKRTLAEIQERTKGQKEVAGITRVSKHVGGGAQGDTAVDYLRAGVTPESYQKFVEGGGKDFSVLEMKEKEPKVVRPTKDQITRTHEIAMEEVGKFAKELHKAGLQQRDIGKIGGKIFTFTEDEKKQTIMNLMTASNEDLEKLKISNELRSAVKILKQYGLPESFIEDTDVEGKTVEELLNMAAGK